MTSGQRLAACLAAAAVVVGGALAWSQWPPAGPAPLSDTSRSAPPGDERLEELRTLIERERDQLREARRKQDRTAAELQALEQSLDEARDRVEQLRQELEAAGDTDGS